jgi:Na+/proline symporter
VLEALLAVTPSPSPTLGVDDEAVTPGVVGFLAILFVTVVTILLIVDMTRRIRRMRYRAAAEQAAPAEAERSER